MNAGPTDTGPGIWGNAANRGEKVHGWKLWHERVAHLLVPPKGQRTLPTKAGWLHLALTVAFGVAAYNTGNNILFLTLSLLLAVLVLSGVLCFLNFRQVRWRLGIDPPVRAGEPAAVYVEIENGKRALPSYALVVRLRAVESGARTRLHLKGRLEAGERRRLDWSFVPEKRGAETVRLEGVETAFPFGLITRRVGAALERRVAVWPVRRSGTFHASGPGRRGRGTLSSRSSGPGEELLRLRGYRPGDPLRDVHWKASARTGGLVVRESRAERPGGFVVWVDPAGWSGDEAGFEAMLARAATLAEELRREGRLHGLRLGREAVRTLRTETDWLRAMDALAVLERPPAEQREASPHAGAPGTVVFRPQGKGGVHAVVEA